MTDPSKPLHLKDLEDSVRAARDRGLCPHDFRNDPAVSTLRHWPVDVIEQWIFDHAGNDSFEADYGHIDLISVGWSLEAVTLDDLMTIPTGMSEAEVVEYFAQDPENWVAVRNLGQHVGVREMWDVHGTWKRWPILLDSAVVDPQASGIQVVEGRTRVGVLRGRARRGLRVAEVHLAWVGRTRT